MSIVAQNKDCYESGIVCMKILVIHVGLTKIYFTDNSGNPVRTTHTVVLSIYLIVKSIPQVSYTLKNRSVNYINILLMPSNNALFCFRVRPLLWDEGQSLSC